MNKSTKEGIPFPQNMLAAILGEVPEQIPEDIIPSLYYVAYECSTRSADFTFAYYREGLSYREIAERYNLTTERIRQVIAKELRRLRHPRRSRIILLGMTEYLKWLKECGREESKQLYEKRVEEEQTWVIQETRRRLLDTLAELEFGEVPEKLVEACKLETKIEALDLSVRAFNCLHRAGIETVTDIIALGPDGLRKLRNLGKKCFEEVAEKLVTEYGESRDVWRFKSDI